jgi:hypothetical protein
MLRRERARDRAVAAAAAASAASGAAPGTAGLALVAPAPADTRSAARVWVSRIVTFQLVCLGWVLFRAASFGNAVDLLSRLAHPGAAPLVTPLVIGVIVLSIASQYVPATSVARAQQRFAELAPVVQGGLVAAGLYLITTLGPQGVAPFIYYRF